ncbi:hypothetical protein LSH36_61g01016 [Paralvinella palmiformis]|uniref:EF-hand domain-containing protein n=1 Tax=Paralvinella palmiformis TaxID=53620 RepID=A0AAD9K471_9ANNE|nr:hypothetical protein LSH36_61g01016 [Paralvinella palmiformis]
MDETSDEEVKRRRRLPRSKSFFSALVENPFVHRLKLSSGDKIRVALMSITIAPIRVICTVTLFIVAWICALLALAGLTEDELHNKPLAGWRLKMRNVVKDLGRLMMFCCGFHHIKVTGKQASAKDAPILVCAPHSSFIDLTVSFISYTLPCGVSRVENAKLFMFGALIRLIQPLLVSREDPNSRQNTIKEIQKRVQSGGTWPPLMIFPEGTCTNRSCLIAFKPGGFYPGVPVQPVCLRYKNKLDTVTWTWDGPGVLKVMWLTLCQLDNKMEIEFLDVYKPSDEEVEKPKLYAANVRDQMAECLGVPTTDHTFEDCRLMLYAQKINFPAAAGLVEFYKISKKLGMNYDNMKESLTKFTQIAQGKKNAVTVEELAAYLEMPVSEPLEEMFAVYDRDGSGTIDFREYVIGLHLVAEPANTEETLQFAFEVFDGGNKGYITECELTEILHNAFGMETDSAKSIFSQVDTNSDGRITYDEFKVFAKKKPEYARLFINYHGIQVNSDGTSDNLDLASKVKEE